MEGPTSSSAIFYGSLSIHAGCYLLLRFSPLLSTSLYLQTTIVLLGIATAAYATLVGRVQADIKSSLAYAALSQVGLIVTEIGLGLETLAFIHIIGHAVFRLLQFLSAPNIVHQHHQLEEVLLDRRRPAPWFWSPSLYLWSMERGLLDGIVASLCVRPVLRLAAGLAHLDQRLAGESEEEVQEQ